MRRSRRASRFHLASLLGFVALAARGADAGGFYAVGDVLPVGVIEATHPVAFPPGVSCWAGGETHVNGHEEKATLVGRVRRSDDGGVPVENVIVRPRPGAAGRRGILLEILLRAGNKRMIVVSRFARS